MPTLTVTLPLLPGKVEAWRRFCQEIADSKRAEYEASRRRLDIVREQFLLVETPVGTAVLLTIESKDVGQAITTLLSSIDPFDRWFRDKLSELHGCLMVGAHLIERGEATFKWSAT